MKKRDAMKVLLTTVAVTALLAGCGGSKNYSMNAGVAADTVVNEAAYDAGGVMYDSETAAFAEPVEDYEYEYGYDDAAVVEEAQEPQDVPQDALAGRKLIKNVNMNVETEQFDMLLPALEQRVTALGGYIEDMSSYSRSNNYSSDYIGTKYLRYASMTARIPKEKLDTFVTEVGEQTNIVSRSESVTDVTLQYVDLESHKKALTTEQDRLLELMGRAETVEDIITIEGRLSEVRYQIESMESQLRTYDNKIDYSTVYLSIDEVERYTPTEDVTVGTKIRDGFMDSVRGVGRGFGNFGIWFVINLPYLVVWAVIIVIIVLIIRKVWKTAAKRRARKAAQRVNPYQQQGGVESGAQNAGATMEQKEAARTEDKD